MDFCSYPCPNKTRHYEIEAIEIPIVYNRYGDHDPNGLLYVLEKVRHRMAHVVLGKEIQKKLDCKVTLPFII